MKIESNKNSHSADFRTLCTATFSFSELNENSFDVNPRDEKMQLLARATFFFILLFTEMNRIILYSPLPHRNTFHFLIFDKITQHGYEIMTLQTIKNIYYLLIILMFLASFGETPSINHAK